MVSFDGSKQQTECYYKLYKYNMTTPVIEIIMIGPGFVH